VRLLPAAATNERFEIAVPHGSADLAAIAGDDLGVDLQPALRNFSLHP